MSTPDLSEFNFTITVDDVATAIKKANAYSTEQRIRRFDDVAAKQGNVMGAADPAWLAESTNGIGRGESIRPVGSL